MAVQDATQHVLASLMRHSSETLKMLKVVVFQIGACSAEMHEDLANMSLKLKFVVNGCTHLKSKAGTASIGTDQQLRIKFDNMDGSAIYEGGDLLHFELYRAGWFRSSQMIASCAVPAMTILQSIFEPKQELNLELIGSDTPGKVLAKLAVQIGFRVTKLEDVGGFRVLKTPGLKLPADPNPVSAWKSKEDREAITRFSKKSREVAKRLNEVHDASMNAIASCTQDGFLLKWRDAAESISMMTSASRPHTACQSSTPEMAESDGVSTSCENLSAEESFIGGCSTESVREVTMPHSSQAIKVSLQPNALQSNHVNEPGPCVPSSPGSVAFLQCSVSHMPGYPKSSQFEEIVTDVLICNELANDVLTSSRLTALQCCSVSPGIVHI